MREQGLLKTISQGIHDMCYIWWLEMRNTVKDEGVLLFFIIVPLAYPLLYSWIYTNEVVREVPIAVVDQAHSNESREFARLMDGSPNIKVRTYAANMEDAKSLMGKQVVHGILFFPKDFSEKINRGEQAHVSAYCDMSLMLGYKALYETATEVSFEMSGKIQLRASSLTSITRRDSELTLNPIKIDNVPIFNPTGGYGNFLLPGVLILILQQTMLLGIGLAAGTVRENNKFRDLVPVSKHFNGIFRIILGKGLCYFMIYMVMGMFALRVVPRIFDFTTLISVGDTIAFLIPYLMACTFFGMTISCLIRYRENVILLIVFTSLPLLFLTGISWPQTSIPGYWHVVSWLAPSTFGIRAFLRLNSMGGTLGDVITEYNLLYLQAVVYFVTTFIVYRWQINRTRRHAKRHFSRMEALTREQIENNKNREP
ncbi:MAG: ABC transporter permease [Prevotella sp.]|nr:ABC transporter permease [Prevotella sp.]